MARRWSSGGPTRSPSAVGRVAGAMIAALLVTSATTAPRAAELAAPDRHAGERQWLAVSGELAQHLRIRDDPRQQVAAALLLASPASRDLPADLEVIAAARKTEAAAIFARARAGTDDPWILWLAAVGCPFEESLCDPDGALRALQRIDGRNAAPWIVSLHRANIAEAGAEVRTALQGMAASDRFDTYEGVGIRTWTDAFMSLPSLPTWGLAAAMTADGDQPIAPLSADQQRAVALAGGLSMAFVYITPPLGGFAEVCVPEKASDEVRQQACRAAAQVLVDSEHLLARVVGLPVAYRFAADDPPAQARLEALRREQGWLTELFVTLELDGFDADGRPDLGEAETMHAAWRDRKSELAMVRDLLRQNGLSPVPPDDYRAPGMTLAEREADRLARLSASSGRSR